MRSTPRSLSPLSESAVERLAAEPIVIGRGRQRRLDLTLARGNIADVNTRAVVLGLFRNVDPDGAASAIDDVLGGAIRELVRCRMFSPDSGSLFVLPTPRTPLRADFVVLAGLGTIDRFGPQVVELVASNITKTLAGANVEEFATVLLGASSGQNSTQCARHLLRGILAGVRDGDPRRRFRELTLVEYRRERQDEIRQAIYAACREDFCDDFEIVVHDLSLPPTARAAAKAGEATSVPSPSPIYLHVRAEEVTARHLTIRAAALTAGSKAALVDANIRIVLATLRRELAKVGRPGFGAVELERLGTTLAATVLPAQVSAQLKPSRKHHLTVIHDRESSLIPWEVLRFGGWTPALDAGLSRRYLAENVAVARWSETRRAQRELRLLLVVDPTEDLPAAKKEGDRIKAMASSTSDLVVDVLVGQQASKSAVLQAIQSERFDVLHYAGHAFFSEEAPGQSGLECADGPLRALELLNLRILPALMFFNACEAARVRGGRRRGAPQGTRVGAREDLSSSVGFAETLMRAGVANYVGTYWPVGDAAAGVFAAEFYGAVMAGESLGHAVVAGRKSVVKLKSIDWADYIHYGAPDFRLKRRTPSSPSGT